MLLYAQVYDLVDQITPSSWWLTQDKEVFDHHGQVFSSTRAHISKLGVIYQRRKMSSQRKYSFILKPIESVMILFATKGLSQDPSRISTCHGYLLYGVIYSKWKSNSPCSLHLLLTALYCSFQPYNSGFSWYRDLKPKEGIILPVDPTMDLICC